MEVEFRDAFLDSLETDSSFTAGYSPACSFRLSDEGCSKYELRWTSEIFMHCAHYILKNYEEIDRTSIL